MRFAAGLLLPLALLLVLVACACLLGYGLLQLAGDIAGLDKIISKTTQLLLVLSIFPLKKYLRLSWLDLGFASSGRLFFKQLLKGLLLSLATLLPVLLTLYALDVHVLDLSRNWTAAKIAEKIGLGLLLALLIALFEEIVFRGLLLTSLRRQMGAMLAIVITSLYYAALHFLKSKTAIPFADISIGSGFKLMVEAFGNWFNPEILSAFVSLFVVGVFLAVLRSRIPHSLGLCIGCHCGWVWQIKVSKDVCNVNPQSAYLYLVSNYDGVIGPLVSVWLTLAIGIFILLSRPMSAKRPAALTGITRTPDRPTTD
ncbi:MAG: CPBP family intramembrane metalloprotease [Methylococcales bacterium]|nr:CPBP family intramembrane metalloprotease [Methylococcales bacterium]